MGVVKGGGRFDKQLYVGSTTDSTSSSTGSARLQGGLGVAKDIHQGSGYSGSVYAGIPGEVRMLAHTSVPSGWKRCDGSTDTNYGSGDACRSVPDFRSRVPIGYDTDRSSERAARGSDDIGGNGGRREFTPAEADIPSHTHNCNHDHNFGFSHTHTMSHTHTIAHDHTVDDHTHTFGHSHSQSHTRSISDHTHTMAHTHGMSHTHGYTDDDHNPNSKQYTDRDCGSSSDWNVYTGETHDTTGGTTGSSSISDTGGASTTTTSSDGPDNTGSNSDTTGSTDGTTSSNGGQTTSDVSTANTGGNSGSTSSNGAQTTSGASADSGTTSTHSSTTGSWGGTPSDVNLDPESVTVNFMIKCTSVHS